MYMYIFTQPLLHKQYATLGQFLVEFYRFEFKVFFLCDRLLYQD